MKLGTHNSMSYLKPKKWYLYPFRFMARCQKKSIEEQYKLGARMFDIRVYYDDKFNAEFRHGSMAFKGDVESTLRSLNSKKRTIYIRLIFEENKYNNCESKALKFIQDCKRWETEYANLKFFCGRRKYDWKQLYKFKLDDINVVQKVSSMTGTILDDWCPWFYAKLYNKKNYKEYNAKEWLLIDFIEYALE